MLSRAKNQKLETTSIEKDLGIVIISDLKSSQQCSQASAKANRILGMINRTVVFKSVNILLQLYKSFVRPHLEYCTAASLVSTLSEGQKVTRKIQRWFTRMVP